AVREPLRSIAVTEPRGLHIIGLVSPHREPIPPLTRALVAEADRLAMPQKQRLESVPRGFASVHIPKAHIAKDAKWVGNACPRPSPGTPRAPRRLLPSMPGLRAPCF